MSDPAPDNLEPATQAEPGWAQVWHLPVLLLGVALLLLGLVLVVTEEPEAHDFTGKMDGLVMFIKANDLESAQKELEQIRPLIGQATQAEQARFYLLDGDVRYLYQKANDLPGATRFEAVLSLYNKAAELGQALDGDHRERKAHALVALGRDAEAMKVLDELKNEPAERRYNVVRRMIQMQMDEPEIKAERVTSLLGRFNEELRDETSADKRRAQELWATSLQAQLLLDAGAGVQAIELLQIRMARLQARGGDADLAPLEVRLAQAYQQIGGHEEAVRWLQTAQQKLLNNNALNADVLVGLGRSALAQGDDVRTALELFAKAETEYPGTPPYLDALIGRADCEARLGDHAEAMQHFARAIQVLQADPLRAQKRVDAVTVAVRSHYDLNYDRDDFEQAMDYLSLLLPLFPAEPPPAVLAEFAVTHEKLAETKLKAAESTEPKGDAQEVQSARDARRLAFQQAAIHFGKAADHYRRHAHAVTVTDDAAYGSSLWASATNYDRAQLWKNAIDVYAEYVRTRPSDPRQKEAVNRLGLSYMADGQYSAAADLFQNLIENHPNAPEAHNSLVPLARCSMAMGNVDAAKRVLLHVVTEHPAITPDAPQYRDALIELGKLYYTQGEFEPAIERLTMAVERYGDSPEGALLRYRLADAYRRSIEGIDETLSQPMPQTRRQQLQNHRQERLERAGVLFTEVISELESRDPRDLDPLASLFYRNAFFYRGDCAYALRRFEQAISLYDLAAKRWEDHPASLVALVQIVNAYCELDRPQQARVANDRARWQLNRIPDTAFTDPNLPMTRKHWEDWLRWSSQLNLFGGEQASAGKSAGVER
jgi:tetratricopeptide (TPR) repeat protein